MISEDKPKKKADMSNKERYRCLTDIIDEQGDLISMADRKARFGVLILGGFNAILIFGAPMGYGLINSLPQSFQILIGVVAITYIFVALRFFILAIDSIRPRTSGNAVKNKNDSNTHKGYRFYVDVLTYDPDEYRKNVIEMDFDEMFKQLAFQISATSKVINAKYIALDHLFSGMRILTIWAGVMILISFVFVCINYFQ